MNYLDLFSGIGGFALGAYWAGFKAENHFYSEIDEYAVDLYKKRFPDSIYLGDITKIDTDKLKKEYPGEWVITGGFPCQDISIAGKGVGLDGKRSGLWFEMWRIIRELRPKFVIAENVSALTFRGLDRVLGSLAEIGYDVEWQDIRASDMGAPHRRERIWIVAYPNADSFNGSESGKQHIGTKEFNGSSENELEARNDVAYPNSLRMERSWAKFQTTRIGGKSKAMANTNSARRKGHGDSTIGRQAKQPLFGVSSWWEVEPDVGRVVNGIPNRVDRLKGLGNSIVPQIAQALFELNILRRNL